MDVQYIFQSGLLGRYTIWQHLLKQIDSSGSISGGLTDWSELSERSGLVKLQLKLILDQ